MAFDQPTRNRLARFVGEARALLTEEFTRQLQHEYGLDPVRGEVAELAKLTQLDDARRETARILRDTLAHYLAGQSMPTAKARQEALDRIVREQAFTVLNRLCALRMAEARGLLIESIAKGYQSKGFQLYARLAGTALGETGDGYRTYLFSLFDEFGVDLAVLFDRFSPQGRLFPRASTLLQLLAAINHPDLEPLWAEDETIGWIYQYFNSKEERKAMRDASQAPRNSRELAVRNQFFTPRYVVEFLTDNTLGRIWYEMTQGQTTLVDSCRYLVRRPREVFLRDPAQPIAGPPSTIWGEQAARGDFSALPEEPDIAALSEFSLIIDGYELAERHGYGDCIDWADQQIAHYRATGEWPTSSLELWLILFRQQRYHGRASHEPEAAFYDEWRSAYRAFRQRLQQNELAQEELLRQPVYIPFRPLKDPRTILMLDPACGSMHFGLYSFDLYERIYEEAWEIEGEVGAQAFQRPAAMAPLHERYRDKASFLRDVPRLIIEHNIHGIDIDPRAVQIAGLSLWLRAQRSWQTQGVKNQERPTIRKSNIVCAEPMPGDKALLEEFLQGLRDDRLEALIRRVLNVPENQRVRATPAMADALCDLVRTVWEEMKLAGEVGSLLKVEEALTMAIARGRKEWDEKLPLFRVTEFHLAEQPKVRLYKNIPGQEEDFWDRAEAMVLAALAEYAEQATNNGYQRRLFVDDAARGFAFIHLCRQRYDVVLMNPPFGDAVKASKLYIEKHFKFSSADISQTFVDCGLTWLSQSGREGIISARTGFFLGDSKDWRKGVIFKNRVECFADLGLGVLDDALVEVAIYVIERGSPIGNHVFIDRQLSTREKENGLLTTVTATCRGNSNGLQFFDQLLIEIIPDYTFAYWAPASLLRRYRSSVRFGEAVAKVRQGIATAEDFRFARLGWEVSYANIGKGRRWQRFSKGGEYSPFYDDIHLLVDWLDDGGQIAASPSARFQNLAFMFQPGASYSARTASAFAAKVLPAQCVFSHMSQTWFAPSLDQTLLSIGYMSCRVPQTFLELGVGAGDIATAGSAARRYTSAVVESVPVNALQALDVKANLVAVKQLFKYRVSQFTRDETSCHFVEFHLSANYRSLHLASELNIREFIRLTVEALDYSAKLDASIIEAFDLTEEEISFVDQEVGIHPTNYTGSADADEVVRLLHLTEANLITEATAKHGSKRWFTKKSYFVDRRVEIICHYLGISPATIETLITQYSISLDLEDYIKACISEIIGCMLGRWDMHFVIGKKFAPKTPEPFTPLPTCAPGMLQNIQGLPAAPSDVPVDYPLRITWSGILVDDPSHPDDILQRVRDVLRIVWPTCADAIEQECCEILKMTSLLTYFTNPSGFFDDHLKRYSKSRRAAPIYWPLSTPSGSYTLWLYYQRLTDQTLYSCVNDFVEPKLKQVNDDVDTLRRRANRSRQEEKELARLSDLAIELAAFRDELLRIARFWQPNLNDGVQITAAPLWRLFQHRAWQKRLKETWAALEAGDYDWAHLAYSIWPERVRAKCKTDKSLAIAHDLEHLYVEPVKPVKAKKGGRKQQQLDDDEQGELL